MSSGRDFNRRKEVHAAGRADWLDRTMSWPRQRQAILSHPADVERYCFFNSAEGLVNSFPGCNTTRQVGNRRTPIAVRILVDANQVLKLAHRFPRLSPACRSTEANVPFGICSP